MKTKYLNGYLLGKADISMKYMLTYLQSKLNTLTHIPKVNYISFLVFSTERKYISLSYCMKTKYLNTFEERIEHDRYDFFFWSFSKSENSLQLCYYILKTKHISCLDIFKRNKITK